MLRGITRAFFSAPTIRSVHWLSGFVIQSSASGQLADTVGELWAIYSDGEMVE